MLIDRSVRLWPGRMIQLFWCYEWHPRWRYWLGREGRWGFDVAFFRRRLMVFSWARGRASYLPGFTHTNVQAAPEPDPKPEIEWSADDPHFGTLRWQDQIYRVRVDPTTHDFSLECDKHPDGLGPTKFEFDLTWLLVRPLIEAAFPPLPPLPL